MSTGVSCPRKRRICFYSSDDPDRSLELNTDLWMDPERVTGIGTDNFYYGSSK
jgi:hypothetical protein